MSTRWEHQAGDTATFAVRVSFQSDPDGGRAIDPDLAASWGSLTMWAAGKNLTAHAAFGETMQSVTWYLLPFLEWVAHNWDPLLHEERLPNRVAADSAASSLYYTRFPPVALTRENAMLWETSWGEWWRRHALQSCREGGPFPDVFIRRWRDMIEVSWSERNPTGVPDGVAFLAASGNERLDVDGTARALFEVLEEATKFLMRQRPESARLQKLQRDVAALANPQAATRRLAMLAGVAESAWTKIVATIQKDYARLAELFSIPQQGDLFVPGSCHGTLLFGSASPSVSPADALKIAQVMVRALDGANHAEIDKYASSEVRHGEPPWQQGYDLAESFREALSMGAEEIPDNMKDVLRRLGVHIHEVRLSDRNTRAISFAGHLCPTVILNQANQRQSLERERFSLAHELCHLLVDKDKGAKLAIASGPWAPYNVEQRANAFAAAFLMPEAAVARAVAHLTSPVDEPEAIRSLAYSLRTSRTAVIGRLHDLGYIDDETQDWLRNAPSDRDDDATH